MRKAIIFVFVFLCVGAIGYFVYQNQYGILKAQLSGLNPADQLFFVFGEQRKLWEFVEAHQKTDEILKGIKISEFKEKCVLKQDGSRLTFYISSSEFMDGKVLDHVIALTKIYLETRKEEAAEKLHIKAEALRARVHESEKNLIEFQKDNSLFITEVTFKEREGELTSALTSAKEKLKKLEYHFLVLKSLDQGHFFSLRDIDVDLPAAKKYRELEQTYEDYRIRYRSKHPKMISLVAELSQLKKILFHALEQQQGVLRAQIGNLESSVQFLKNERLQAAPVRERMETLEKEVKQDQEVYQQTLHEYDRLKYKANYEVILTITTEGGKEAAQKALFYFGGIFLVFLVGVGGFSILDKRIYHPKHIARIAQDIVLLAITPRLSKRDLRIPLHSHYQPASAYSKSIVTVRNRLLAQYQGKSTVLVVASASKVRNGISLISNLAISLAQSQKKVLLVDCQLHEPRQHSHFRLKNQGLAQVLQNHVEWSKMIAKVEVPNLHVMPSGEGLTLKSLCSEVFGELLKTCRSHYDFIFLDAPPMSLETDSILIAQRTDGVILTIPSGRVTKQTLLWAKNEMHRAGVKLVGVILKEVSPDRAKSWSEISIPHRITT